ncbi:hypothetical protein LX87_04486 [Larkinella arboricola]|uniref:Lipoprotein n=1 Tax=Larkinella arboricola TaxID=643671 RepID=A0A327WNA2_LARAB|nr:hypothetical protein [Larkinella arboricola]RAJ92974.1 hypothetical protein LX87_04486 [Larkinella arboricola]
MQTKLFSSLFTHALLAICLLACNSTDKSENQPTNQTSTSVNPSDTTLNTETVMEHPTPPPPALLSSQKGPDDSQVDLLKAQVKGSILTVELQYKPGSEDKPVSSTYAINQVSVTDEVTTKTYSVMKDGSGHYMASPMRTDQGKQLINIAISSYDKPVAVWFKFPAPPVDTKTIAIKIPDVGTYKGIPISR